MARDLLGRLPWRAGLCYRLLLLIRDSIISTLSVRIWLRIGLCLARLRRFFDDHISFSRVLCLICLGLGSGVGRAHTVDLNGNGMSDIWEWLYNAYGVNPNADPDGDGFSNRQESIAGTNPFDSNSYPFIPFTSNSTTNFSVTLPCQLGKQYQLQSTDSLGSTNWVIETNVVARSGTKRHINRGGDFVGEILPRLHFGRGY